VVDKIDEIVNLASKGLTSQISSFRFEEEFKRLTASGDDVVVITNSSKPSGTYNSALI